jgi:O-antigen/teichoic acid export membrane protein
MTTLLSPSPSRGTSHDHGGMGRGSLAGVLGAVVAGSAGVAVAWVVARGLGAAGAGAVFAATAGFVLASGVAKVGTQTGLVYWVARLRGQGRSHLLAACLRIGLAPVVVAACLVGVLLVVVAPGPLGIIAVFLPLAAFSDTALAATRGYRMMRPTVLLDRIGRPTLQLTAVGALAIAGVASPAAYALAWVAPYLPAALLAGYALRRAYLDNARPPASAASRAGRAIGHKAYRMLRAQFWRFTGPRAFGSVAQLALQRVDVLLVASLGGLAAAATYAVASRFIVLGQFANQGISHSVQPRLAEALATGDRGTANSLYQTATCWLVLTTWPLHLTVIAYAPVYLGLFGDAYRAGGPVVVVLASAMLVATGCGMVDVVLSMAGRTRWNLANVTAALAIMIVLDLLLIPRFGAVGAAVGLAVALLVNNIVPLIQVGRAVGLHPFGRGTVTAGALAFGCFGVLPYALPTPPLASLAVAATTYAAAVWHLRATLGLAR